MILLALLLICSVSASAETKTYEKVTSALTDYSGEYLIVYEAGKVAFDGSRTEIDKAGNYISVTIGTDKTISTDNNYSVTISKSTTSGSYYIKTTSGYYIGRTENKNGLDVSTTTKYDNTINISNGNTTIKSSGASFQYFSQKNSERFRYYASSQQAICLYKLKKATNPDEPSISVDGSVNLGTCNINETATKQITVTGANLSEKIAVSMTGDNVFSIDKNELEAAGGELTITYAPTEIGSHTATITLTSGTTTATIEVTANAKDPNIPADAAYLPFAYDSGSSNLPTGLTQNGLGSDYSSSPKLKFDGSGDYLILKLASAPYKLSYDIKGNSPAKGLFEVQVSTNGENYTTINSYTEKNNTTETETIKLPADTRFIKWVYTTKTSGNVALGNIKVSALPASDKFSISTSKWATYYTDLDFTMPENATGYIVVPSGSDANAVSLEKTYNAGDAVPANTPILINGEAGEYTYYVTTTTATADSRNMLRGQLEAGTITPEENGEYLYYKLSYNSYGNALGFYWGAENGGVFSLTGSNRAYLVVESTGSNAKAVKVNWPGDETTGISDIRTDKANDEAIYNIAGQRVTKATKGIYIKNGKKFIAK